ncbi:hypothetical protein [Helicobacter cinaedi]|uniref:hypothetical protein n=1 Tax=Helicobacter cinaedi TaxID=213 RepID=UPI0015F08EEA|nr:hypothetical protein [Helicobacter cinaedi]
MEIKSLKNISYRIYGFFFALLCFSLSSMVLFTQDNDLHKAIGKEVPNIEMTNFTLYMLTPQYCQAISEGTLAMRFENREELYELFIHQVNNKLNEYLYAPYVLSKNRIYTFSQGADYLRLDGLSFWSKWGVYDYNKRIFQGKEDFILQNNTTQATGQNIFYDSVLGEVKADTFKADILLGEKL